MHRRIFLGLGSNMGDRREHLRAAVASLPDVVAVSPIYETEPIGPAGQSPHLNAVVELRSALGAKRLLALIAGIEAEHQRERREKNGPRTLDIDILWIDGESIEEPNLQVPHPRMWQRRFVLQPLSDLAPELLPEDWENQATGWVQPVGSL